MKPKPKVKVKTKTMKPMLVMLTLVMLPLLLSVAVSASTALADAQPPVLPVSVTMNADANAEAAALAGLLPAAWQAYATLALVLLPLLGRAWHALVHNGGLRGVWNAVMFGTNTPQAKALLLGACVLALASCAPAVALMASPFGQSAQRLAQQLVQAEETVLVEQVLARATARLALLRGSTRAADQAESAALQIVIANAQMKHEALTAAK